MCEDANKKKTFSERGFMRVLKDYKTKQESWTFTATVISFFAFIIILFLTGADVIKNEAVLWASMGATFIFFAIYKNKRIKASSSGIEFGGKCE